MRGGVWAEASFRGDGSCDGSCDDDDDEDEDEDGCCAEETKWAVDAGAPAGAADNEDAVDLGALLGCAAAALLVAAGTLPKELPRLAKAAPSAVAGIRCRMRFLFFRPRTQSYARVVPHTSQAHARARTPCLG
jgi:hypothetical protein